MKCKYCNRRIVEREGEWIDPMATGDDEVWRYSCDENRDVFDARHEPQEEVTRYHLVTATVTYRVDGAHTMGEAVGMVREAFSGWLNTGRVTLESEREGFCSEIAEGEHTGIRCVDFLEFGIEA